MDACALGALPPFVACSTERGARTPSDDGWFKGCAASTRVRSRSLLEDRQHAVVVQGIVRA
jgi:hypothetical protein